MIENSFNHHPIIIQFNLASTSRVDFILFRGQLAHSFEPRGDTFNMPVFRFLPVNPKHRKQSVLRIRLSENVTFEKFRLSKGTVAAHFGQINDSFIGTICILSYQQHSDIIISATKQRFEREPKGDTIKEFCFRLLQPKKIVANYHYTIELERAPFNHRMFTVKQITRAGVELYPYIHGCLHAVSFLTYFSALQFKRCPDVQTSSTMNSEYE